MMRNLNVPDGALEGATQRAKRVSRDPIIAGTAGSASVASVASVADKAIRKLTVRISADLRERIKAAYIADRAAGSGLDSINAWAAHHLELAVVESEKHGPRTSRRITE